MIGSWIVYDLLCRSPLGRNNKILGVVVFGLLMERFSVRVDKK
jgi:uncharacterized membrane protein